MGKETVKVNLSSVVESHRPQSDNDVITQVLLEHNAKVYMGARDEKKARAAIEELRQSTGKEAIFLELNLANLSSVKKSAEAFLRYASCISPVPLHV